MTNAKQVSLFSLRVLLGWMYLYAGLTQLTTPAWSAEAYLKSAKSAVWLFQTLLQPNILPVINFVNAWGLALLGLSLILGLCVRLSSLFGSVLMFLYYLAILSFPIVDQHAFLVDQHIIYIVALGVLSAHAAGRTWGLDAWLAKQAFSKQHPHWQHWLG